MSLKSAFFCLFFFLSPLILIQCASLEKKECENIHWPTQGFDDGAQGRYSRLSQFLAKCSPHKVQVNSDDYLEGYQKGLEKFCSEESGFSRGVQGLEPEKICSDSKKYQVSYDSGKQNYCTYDIGLEDAKKAKPAKLFCERDTKYFEGYQVGLQNFCTPESGYQFGYEGKEKTEICSNDPRFKKGFQLGYERGRVDFLRQENERLKSNIKLAETELKMVKNRYTDKLSEAYEMSSASQDPYASEKKIKLDSEINLIKQKKSKLEQEVFDLQKQINKNNAEIGEFSASEFIN